MEIAKGEVAESQIDNFIERRDRERRQTEGERAEEEAYAESVRRYNERQHNQRLWEKLRYHEGMIRSHTANFEAIIGGHRREVLRCEEMLGIAELGEIKGERLFSLSRNGHKKGVV